MAEKNFIPSRRNLLKAGAMTSIFVSGLSLSNDWPGNLPALAADQADPFRGLKVGITSYTTRKLSLDDTIKALDRLGLKYISLKDFHLPLKSSKEERQAIAQKVRGAGLNLVGCGVITMKDETEVRAAFEYARDAGIPTIVGTLDPDKVQFLDQMVKEFNIRVAIHNHGPEDKRFPTPDSVASAIEKLDPRIGLCIDIGHTIRAGVDPAQAIRKHAKRLYDLHLKDVTAAVAQGKNIECGRGVIDLASVLKALREIKFQDHVALEYEINADDPVPGMAESIGYVKGILSMAAA
ncbi:MAG TPA: sugar phosphate isomerase/epimerase [Blastocatellia bacterium]|nr:sugar phosphate isomerase/epimerase [Blastocatellia bacterium]